MMQLTSGEKKKNGTPEKHAEDENSLVDQQLE